MKLIRLVLITIGMGLAAVLTAGAQTVPDLVNGALVFDNATRNPRVSCDEFTQNPQ